ncbi:glycerophosphodiester phosphodiesterase [Prosthecobacter vanneervenii]|uniref:Glycerophosphoryl diester phosphodiesterase n=1 Tax=Prosthecobacter vanneervenii TaxID=48466 RepID=A0A7W7YBJ8_9BACT|nr:glycerophosphodiester phosphodiesterase [Prosthecobacter vanneervenii]MBB5033099.1 glycerophosphoryl diester phosphodiesterase [Prosthecobacter vanneervenii]
MKTIAHRGGMGRGLQNSPAGVRLAAQHQADYVELDVVRAADGEFHCAHFGWNTKSALRECLAEIGPHMRLIAHLKGDYTEADLICVTEYLAAHLPWEKVVLASHRSRVLWRMRQLIPDIRLARFGLLPALAALWRRQPWDCCMVNQLVLTRWLVQALQRRGYEVVSSCVWELRSRQSVRRLGVDGAFVNLHEGQTMPLVSGTP